uniref:Serine/threonine-protein kinase greatwall n=1 Tax=Ditylenchus dipsaci TaxID=166011 RepID=A0A915EI13_9BILA
MKLRTRKDQFLLSTELPVSGTSKNAIKHSLEQNKANDITEHKKHDSQTFTDVQNHAWFKREQRDESSSFELTGQIKLIDFGVCIVDGEGEQWAGDPEYTVPNKFKYKKPFSYSDDWWAFGVLMYRMLFRKVPFKSENDSLIFPDSNMTKINITEDLKQVFLCLFNPDIAQRCGASDIPNDTVN